MRAGEADQEMPVGFADIAGIHRAGAAIRGIDENRPLRAASIRSTSPRREGAPGRVTDCAAIGDERGVLDEASVRVPRICGQDRQREPAVRERFAVALVL